MLSVPWRKSLKFRLTVIIAFVSLFSGAAMLLFLTSLYHNRINKEFRTKAVAIARSTASLIDAQTVDRYLLTLEKDHEYERILEYLRVKKRENGILYICVSRIFEGGEIFVFDSDEDAQGHVDLGETIIWREREFDTSMLAQVLNGENVEPYSQRTRWGWLYTALEPIFREDGSVAAHAAASISMNDVMYERRIGLAILGSVIILFFCISVFINLHNIQKFVIAPIKKISQGVSAYLPGSNQPVIPKQQALPALRYGDELEMLERVIQEMESRVFISIEAERKASNIKSKFLANMSHDLKTPLNSIMNMIREAMSDAQPKKKAEALQYALDSSNDLLSALNTILAISNDTSNRGAGENFPLAQYIGHSYEAEVCKANFYGKQILIVDDVPLNRTVLKNILLPTGIEVIEAKDGKQAVDIFHAESENISAILMDIMMPVMDGYEAAQEIRASKLPNAQTIPIIAVTTLSYQEDVQASINAGMDFHIAKPVDPKTLVITLMRFFEKIEICNTIE